jgi:hypothetical protein
MHISTRQVLRYFKYDHLPNGDAKAIARMFSDLAKDLSSILPEDPETTVALRKLLESKDAAVRSVLKIEV